MLPLRGGTHREVIRGRKPMAGWVSFKYSEVKWCPRTVRRYNGSGLKATFVTVLVPGTPGEKPPAATLLSAEFGKHYAVRIKQGRRITAIEIDRSTTPRRIVVNVSP